MKMTRARLFSGRHGLTRRQWLKALGVGAAVAPLLPALESHAQAPPARRLVLVFSPCGIVPETFWPSGTETTWSFPAGGILEPLGQHKADLNVWKGLSRGATGGGAHDAAIATLWTNHSASQGRARAASVDQIVAAMLPRTRFPSLHFGAMCTYAGEGDITSKLRSPSSYMIHRGLDQRVRSEDDPYVVFDRIFGSGSGDAAAVARRLQQRKSVLDLVAGELAALGPRVSREDRMRTDGHLQSLRAIEQRLATTAPAGAPPRPGGGLALDRASNFPHIIGVMNDLLVAALAGDHTRVATMQYSRPASALVHAWIGRTRSHHALSHLTTEKPALTAISRWYMERVADLLTKLKAIPMGAGTLLSHTLLIYGNELSEGWSHRVSPAPCFWAGQAGGAVRTGRFLDFAGNTHGQMLVTAARAMGVQVERIGDVGLSGVLPGVLS